MGRVVGDADVCGRGHPRTAENTRIGKNGGRACRVCDRERDRAKRARSSAFGSRRRPLGTPADRIQLAAFRAANEAGVLDELLRRRLDGGAH